MAEAGQNRPCHDSDAPVGVSVLHRAILRDSLQTLEEAVGNLRKEGRLNEDVFDPAPLQFADERLRFGSGTPQRVRKYKLSNFVTGDDN